MDLNKIIDEAMAYPVDSIVLRYMDIHGVSEGEAQRHAKEVKRFLLLCSFTQKKERGYLIGGALDAFWHEFILFTKSYSEFCGILGRFIHHAPRIPGRAIPKEDVRQSAMEYARHYQEVFGEPPPPEMVLSRPECSDGECSGNNE